MHRLSAQNSPLTPLDPRLRWGCRTFKFQEGREREAFRSVFCLHPCKNVKTSKRNGWFDVYVAANYRSNTASRCRVKLRYAWPRRASMDETKLDVETAWYHHHHHHGDEAIDFRSCIECAAYILDIRLFSFPLPLLISRTLHQFTD